MSIYREEFKQYILRRLGAPVIQINVSDDQVEDRIDDALQFYIEHHFDGVEKIFMKHVMTQEDIDNRYIEVPDHVQTVVRVVNPESFSRIQDGLFDPKSQFMFNEMFNLSDTNMINYDNAMKHINLVEQLVGKGAAVRFNKNKSRIELDVDWSEIRVGKTFLFEVYRALDPEEWIKVYKDRWLKAYATALVKMQWGQNMSKFSGVQLPGGITMNGAELKEEAKAELDLLEAELRDGYAMPLDIFVG